MRQKGDSEIGAASLSLRHIYEAQSLAQHVKTGGLFRDQRGLPLRDDQHPGGKTQFRRNTGDIAKQNERIVEQIVARRL